MAPGHPVSGMHLDVSLVVKAPRDRVYLAYTDFEAAPRWSKQMGVVRVLKRDGNVVQLARTSERGARKAVVRMKLFHLESVESEGETRFTRTKSLVRFEEVAGGTRVTASLDVQLKGRWGWVLRTQGKGESESSIMDELTAFAGYVERLPGERPSDAGGIR